MDHEAVEKPSEPVADPEQPQAGDTSGNQICVPGFGWVENHGGGGSGTAARKICMKTGIRLALWIKTERRSTTSMWCFFFSQIPGKETRLPVVGKEDT